MEGISVRGLDLRSRLEQAGLPPMPPLRAIMESRNVALPDFWQGHIASLLVVDADLRIVEASGPAFQTPGFRPEDLIGQSVVETLMPEEDRALLTDRYRAAAGGVPQSFEYFGPGGGTAYRVQILPFGAAGSEPGMVISISHDLTAVAHMTLALAQSEARLRDAERMIGIGSWELDLEERSLSYSSGFARALGLTRDTVELEEILDRVHPDDRQALQAAVETCAREGAASGLMRVKVAGGEYRTFELRGEAVQPDSGTAPRYLRGAALDVTDLRRAERERSEAISLFQQGFDAAPVGMALIDPDTGRYLRVNGALGELLGRTTEELCGLTVFDVIHPDSQNAVTAARKQLDAGDISQSQAERQFVRADGSSVWLSVHAAPVRRTDGRTRALFAQHFDVTERRAREARMLQDVHDAQWLARIRGALDEDRFRLYAQPIVDLRTGETVQRELLLRMVEADGEVVLPGEFLAVAERYGVIGEIDRWVIRQAVDAALITGPCQLNLSAASISDPAVLAELSASLERTGLDPGRLVVEVTETTMVDNLDAGEQFARSVQELGCGLALDDFGTGYAGLSHLRRIPATHLKIDMEFVRELAHSATDQRMVRGIVGLASEFGQLTIAEGIEDEETLLHVREVGVTHGQGYLFGRPEPLATDPGHEPEQPHEPASEESVELVRRLLDSLPPTADEYSQLMHDDFVLRPQLTMRLAQRSEPYRGREGMLEYFRDRAEVWGELRTLNTTIRPAGTSVIVFAQVAGTLEGRRATSDVLSVVRLRDGKIASFDTVQTPPSAR